MSYGAAQAAQVNYTMSAALELAAYGVTANVVQAAALAPGSLIAISHLTADYAPQAIADSAAAYNARVPVQVHPRTRDQLTAICGALPVQHPGVVPVNFWLASPHESPGPAVDLHAAVLRLPLPARITTASRPLTRPQPSPQEQAAELDANIGPPPGLRDHHRPNRRPPALRRPRPPPEHPSVPGHRLDAR